MKTYIVYTDGAIGVHYPEGSNNSKVEETFIDREDCTILGITDANSPAEAKDIVINSIARSRIKSDETSHDLFTHGFFPYNVAVYVREVVGKVNYF